MAVIPVSAHVAQSNTEITDRMARVSHEVHGELDGRMVTTIVVATDPLDAINIARNIPDYRWS